MWLVHTLHECLALQLSTQASSCCAAVADLAQRASTFQFSFIAFDFNNFTLANSCLVRQPRFACAQTAASRASGLKKSKPPKKPLGRGTLEFALFSYLVQGLNCRSA